MCLGAKPRTHHFSGIRLKPPWQRRMCHGPPRACADARRLAETLRLIVASIGRPGVNNRSAEEADISACIGILTTTCPSTSAWTPKWTKNLPLESRPGCFVEELLAGDRAIAEHTEHARGDEVGAGLHDPACGHAEVLGLQNHADALRL